MIHCISMYSAWLRSTFRRVLKFLQIKEGRPNFWGGPILQKVWIILSPLLDFNFKSFMDAISSSFIRFQCILHDSRVVFWECWRVCKLKSRDLISRGNQFCKKSELFGPPFCISSLKVLWTQIHSDSPEFNAFCMILNWKSLNYWLLHSVFQFLKFYCPKFILIH